MELGNGLLCKMTNYVWEGHGRRALGGGGQDCVNDVLISILREYNSKQQM